MRSLILAFALLLAAPAAPAARDPDAAAYRTGELLVRWREPAVSSKAMTLKARLGLRSKLTLLDGRAELLALPGMVDVPAAVALLEQDPDVLYAEPNYLRRPLAAFPDDPLFPIQWGLHNTGQSNFFSSGPSGIPDADMDLPEAWDSDGDGVADRTGDGSVIVAVVDEGVATEHPDLRPNIVPGFDFLDNDADPNPPSHERHGTLVAGCVGAVGNNGIGVASPAWKVGLMPLRFGFDVASEVKALQFARDRGARIINASYGGPGASKAEFEAIADLARHDILFVAAAGNSDSDIDRSVWSYPANHDLPNIVAVAATNRQDSIASFSQFGPISVDVAAPGLQIITTDAPDLYTPIPGVAGTSFATPYTSGIAALIRMVHPTASALEVRARLIEGADPGVDPAFPARHLVASGRVNADNSLDLTPRPSLVIRQVRLMDADGALDPGETLPIEVTLESLWQTALNVTATLTADPGITVISGPTSFGHMPQGNSTTRSFSVQVNADAEQHRYLDFRLLIEADGYRSTRNFRFELARLRNGVAHTDTLQTTAYDEFHTWHFDLPEVPPDAEGIVFETSSPNDIDILIKRGRPARYFIDLARPPDSEASYSTDADAVGGSDTGNERVVITAQPGTYFVTVVNYTQKANNPYTIQVTAGTPATQPPPEQPPPTQPPPAGGSGGGGGGALTWTLAGLSLALMALRLRTGRTRRGCSCSPAHRSAATARHA